jgi:hypothetical protein
MNSEPVYGLVGRGRLALHLGHYLRQKRARLVFWDRADPSPPEAALKDAGVLLLAVRDGAIAPFLQDHPSLLEGRRAVHFSGACSAPPALRFHPLATFGPSLYEEGYYERVPFTGGAPEAEFRAVFPSLGNPYFRVPEGSGALYHALCTASGNFSTLLWQGFFSEMGERFGIPKEALFPYMEKTFENLRRDPGQALTGPIARKDERTIEAHLKALSGHPLDGIYRAFLHRHYPGPA